MSEEALTLREVTTYLNELRTDLDRLRGIERWAIKSLDLGWEGGGRVRLTCTPNTDNGWRPYRECLIEGAEGTASAPFFSVLNGQWYAYFKPDREWSVHERGQSFIRFWNGRADETPEGFRPPSEYDQRTHPDGTRHTFMMRVTELEAVGS